ncbi:protein of unknown function DUF402 [Cellulomonas flavigena DSM 20109]|uniref:DUF402 domain-containing protein n=1 Tax=Cellulomonas flavigena (strain ATCC 482 / DSM 20109 / BCRC 11376 / JCM 18109 / NBRC 3775 / NCIMB 8073 / NRS 134) TaxID=446466 RepID=D5UDJ3_CELFN|nr:DUF402 domain-containing protein [Cellulomonas flavigena]ADG76449.1 protein of unknown function DUF402 [Cellulomonas flavigena DSM 20109]
MADHFRPGDQVVVREVVEGLVWTERPATVVVDEPDEIVLHQAVGSVTREPIDPSQRRDYLRIMAGRRWTLRDKVWQPPGRLRIGRPGQPFEVWRVATPDERGVAAWYVNLQAPLRRTADGFETLDHVLDVIVAPDLSWWEWKDEDELAAAVAHGVLTAREAAEVRATGEDVVAAIERGAPPWDLGWATWDPSGPTTLPTRGADADLA